MLIRTSIINTTKLRSFDAYNSLAYADIDKFLSLYAVDDSKFEDVIDEILGDIF